MFEIRTAVSDTRRVQVTSLRREKSHGSDLSETFLTL